MDTAPSQAILLGPALRVRFETEPATPVLTTGQRARICQPSFFLGKRYHPSFPPWLSLATKPTAESPMYIQWLLKHAFEPSSVEVHIARARATPHRREPLTSAPARAGAPGKGWLARSLTGLALGLACTGALQGQSPTPTVNTGSRGGCCPSSEVAFRGSDMRGRQSSCHQTVGLRGKRLPCHASVCRSCDLAKQPGLPGPRSPPG